VRDPRARLARRTQTAGLDALARAALDRFTGSVHEPKAPKAPTTGAFPGAKQAYRLKMSGQLPGSGTELHEEVLLAEHGNRWVYEAQVTTVGGAAQLYRKDVKAFWAGLRARAR